MAAFHDMAVTAHAGPQVVMQGISEALIATAAGLLVAIPAVMMYNYLKMKVKVVLRQTEALFRELLAYGVDNFDGERRDSGKEMLVKPMVSAGKR
jgi:biopolymer transport protein ExbB